MAMDMQHGPRHAAWTWPCSMDLEIQDGHGHAAQTWTCRMDLDKQHGYLHAVWTWTCSWGMDRHQGHGRALRTWKSTIGIDMHHGSRNTDKKFSPASLVFLKFTALCPASAFLHRHYWHRGQSGTAGHVYSQLAPSSGDMSSSLKDTKSQPRGESDQ